VLVAAMLVIVLPMNVSAATTWYVDDVAGSGSGNPAEDFTSIQDAVDAASSGDTVYVYAGTYNEQVTIEKTLTLEGENKDTTIVQGPAGGSGIWLKSVTGVTVKNFHVKGARWNIKVESSSGNIITNNKASDSSWFGIFLIYSSNNEIIKNTVTGNSYGMYLRFSSNNNLLKENTATGNSYGIRFYPNPSYNELDGNIISNNGEGIDMYFGTKNKLRNNVFTNNDYNFDVGASTPEQYDHDIDTSNTINGKPIYYWVGKTSGTISSSAGYVGVISCKNILVKDVTLTNNDQGLLLAYTTDSTVENVVVKNNWRGIISRYGGSNTIKKNTVSDNVEYGIYLDNSVDNNVLENTVTNHDTGIFPEYSDGNTISKNTVSGSPRGILMDYCESNTLSGNTLTGCGIVTLGFEKEEWNTHTIDTTNTANGKPVYYWKDKTSGKIPNGAGQVILANCQNVVVKKQDVSYVSVGIAMGFSSNCEITENVASNCVRGMYFQNSDSNTVSKNTCLYNQQGGIHIDVSNYNLITENTCSNGDFLGIYTSTASSKNVIKDNTVSDNNGAGIRTDSASGTIIKQNTISGNKVGIYPYRSNNNIIKANKISSCTVNGIRFYMSSSNIVKENTISENNDGLYLYRASGNTFYHNNIIDNNRQAYLRLSTSNIWDNGAGEGNYWSDYTGSDTNNDGIGDTDIPHLGLDNYPLMEPWDAVDKIEDLIEDVEDLNLPKGTENSLLSKLENAIKSINKENYNAAANQLEAFINEVEALKGKKLTDKQADVLMDDAGAAQWLI
jgi:parallel beta-helix repeat protein